MCARWPRASRDICWSVFTERTGDRRAAPWPSDQRTSGWGWGGGPPRTRGEAQGGRSWCGDSTFLPPAPSCPQHVPTKPLFPRPEKWGPRYAERFSGASPGACRHQCLHRNGGRPGASSRVSGHRLRLLLKSAARKQGFVLSIFNECPQGKNYFPIVALIKNKTKQKEPTVNT